MTNKSWWQRPSQVLPTKPKKQPTQCAIPQSARHVVGRVKKSLHGLARTRMSEEKLCIVFWGVFWLGRAAILCGGASHSLVVVFVTDCSYLVSFSVILLFTITANK